jgi:hypothetical protein
VVFESGISRYFTPQVSAAEGQKVTQLRSVANGLPAREDFLRLAARVLLRPGPVVSDGNRELNPEDAVQIENPTDAMVLMGLVPMALVRVRGRIKPPRRDRPPAPR